MDTKDSARPILKVANEGVLFENAYSPYIPTTPGYATMLSGMGVMTHKIGRKANG